MEWLFTWSGNVLALWLGSWSVCGAIDVWIYTYRRKRYLACMKECAGMGIRSADTARAELFKREGAGSGHMIFVTLAPILYIWLNVSRLRSEGQRVAELRKALEEHRKAEKLAKLQPKALPQPPPAELPQPASVVAASKLSMTPRPPTSRPPKP